MRWSALWLSLVLALAIGCGGDAGSAPDAGEPPPGQSPFSVEFTTTAGTFTVDVTPDWSPRGAARFRELVEAGFYDESGFFRVVPGFVVQFGINGDPATHAEYSDSAIQDDPVVESNVRGRVTFAMTGQPNSRTTQLFINYGDNSFLDEMGFAPFGEVRVGGMEVVDAIEDAYGESPDQALIESQGNSYLMTNFPDLDYIETARVLP